MTTTTTTEPLRDFYGCPAWCELEAERHDISLSDDQRAVIIHDGPRFGPYLSGGGETHAETGEVYEVDITVADIEYPFAGTLSAEALRQLSVDALAAAEWLEAQQ
jgi:hypothetical protein